MRHRICFATLILALLALGGGPAFGATPVKGEWKHHVVRSPATGKIERFWVGHRKGLDPNGSYPVLYLLPGLLGNEHKWKQHVDEHLPGRDVIVVSTSVGGSTWYMNSPAREWMNWGDFLTKELPAFIEANYPASREKGQRGIGGISAGAHGALRHALRTNLYGSVSVISPAIALRAYAGNFGLKYWVGPRSSETRNTYARLSSLQMARRADMPLAFSLFLDAGSKDPAKRQLDALRQVLDAKEKSYKWHAGQGGHNWGYWQKRVEDHLAWHLEQFETNREKARYQQTPPEVDKIALQPATYPEIGLSDETRDRLTAPWAEGKATRTISISGFGKLPRPIGRQRGEMQGKLAGTARLSMGGYTPRFACFRLKVTLSTPSRETGTVGLNLRLHNGQGGVVAQTSLPLEIPAGESGREVVVPVRVAVELKEPDPLRGGIVLAAQTFDERGRPAGEPALGTARPGTLVVERWPIAPQAMLEIITSVADQTHLPLAAVRKVELAYESD